MTSDEYANALGDMAKAHQRLTNADYTDRVDRAHIGPLPSQMGTPIDFTDPDWANPTATVKAPRTVWDIIVAGQFRRLGQFARDSARFKDAPTMFDEIANRDLIRSLTVHCLADKLPPEEVVESVRVIAFTPASWWQHFKMDHQTRWWLRALVRRRPVRMTDIVRQVTVTVDLRRWRSFPEADVPYPKEFGPVRYQSDHTTRSRITDPSL